jgi:putative oxidoreductase
MTTTAAGKWQAMLPQFQGILRIMVAATFITHGTAKLFAVPYAVMPDGSTVALFSQMGAAGVLETFGGALLLLGLFTRPVAFLLSGEMAVAYFQFHFPNSPWPWANNGELPFLFCFIWLFFSAAGAGALGIDSILAKRF